MIKKECKNNELIQVEKNPLKHYLRATILLDKQIEYNFGYDLNMSHIIIVSHYIDDIILIRHG